MLSFSGTRRRGEGDALPLCQAACSHGLSSPPLSTFSFGHIHSLASNLSYLHLGGLCSQSLAFAHNTHAAVQPLLLRHTVSPPVDSKSGGFVHSYQVHQSCAIQTCVYCMYVNTYVVCHVSWSLHKMFTLAIVHTCTGSTSVRSLCGKSCSRHPQH